MSVARIYTSSGMHATPKLFSDRSSLPGAIIPKTLRLGTKPLLFPWQPCKDRQSAAIARSSLPSCVCSPAYKTYTNYEGKLLTNISDNVWAAERPFEWNGIDVNGRMVVIRLLDGSLWVHSPIGIDDSLMEALAKLGLVKHIVAPNYWHVKFAGEWKEAYPDAQLYACPGLADKCRDVNFDHELGNSAPAAWQGQVQCCYLSYEQNPFTGAPIFNEYPKMGIPMKTILYKFGMNRIYAPFYRSFMIRKKDVFKMVATRILEEWDFQGIIPCHGEVLRTGGKAALKAHLGL